MAGIALRSANNERPEPKLRLIAPKRAVVCGPKKMLPDFIGAFAGIAEVQTFASDDCFNTSALAPTMRGSAFCLMMIGHDPITERLFVQTHQRFAQDVKLGFVCLSKQTSQIVTIMADAIIAFVSAPACDMRGFECTKVTHWVKADPAKEAQRIVRAFVGVHH